MMSSKLLSWRPGLTLRWGSQFVSHNPIMISTQNSKFVSTLKGQQQLIRRNYSIRSSKTSFVQELAREVFYYRPIVLVSLATGGLIATTGGVLYYWHQKGTLQRFLDGTESIHVERRGPKKNGNGNGNGNGNEIENEGEESSSSFGLPLPFITLIGWAILWTTTGIYAWTKSRLDLSLRQFLTRVNFSINTLDGKTLKFRTLAEIPIDELLMGNSAAVKMVTDAARRAATPSKKKNLLNRIPFLKKRAIEYSKKHGTNSLYTQSISSSSSSSSSISSSIASSIPTVTEKFSPSTSLNPEIFECPITGNLQITNSSYNTDPLLSFPYSQAYVLGNALTNIISQFTVLPFFQADRGMEVERAWYVLGLTFEKNAPFKKLRVQIVSEDLLLKFASAETSLDIDLENPSHHERKETLELMSSIYTNFGSNNPNSCLWKVELAIPKIPKSYPYPFPLTSPASAQDIKQNV